MAVIELFELTVKAAEEEPKATAVAPAKCDPVIVTTVPPLTGPALGTTPLMRGPRVFVSSCSMTSASEPSAKGQTAPAAWHSRSGSPWVGHGAVSLGPPTTAPAPSLESAMLHPKVAFARASPPVSFGPSRAQVVPVARKYHAAPFLAASAGAPTSAVRPSLDSATLYPNIPAPTSPVPV